MLKLRVILNSKNRRLFLSHNFIYISRKISDGYLSGNLITVKFVRC